jgi:hypothetical protein
MSMFNSYPEMVELVIVRVDNRLGLFTQEDHGLREHWHTQYRPSNRKQQIQEGNRC